MEHFSSFAIALSVAIGLLVGITLWVILMSGAKPIQNENPDDHTKSTTPGRRADGSNIIPTADLFRSFMLSALLMWLSWRFFKDEKAIFTFSKHSASVIEVSGPFSSLLGSLAMLAAASSFMSVIIDHFDRRQNEHIYKQFMSRTLAGSLICIILSILVGWQLEHIQLVNK